MLQLFATEHRSGKTRYHMRVRWGFVYTDRTVNKRVFFPHRESWTYNVLHMKHWAYLLEEI